MRHFKLTSPLLACIYSFVGSKVEKCTAAIRCKGKLTEGEGPKGCQFSSNQFEVYDGTNGKMRFCGNSEFDNITRIPRNGGTDLYVQYRAFSKSAECSVFCAEDEENNNVEELPINKEYERTIESTCVCGIRKPSANERVIKGSEAQPFEFPWITPLVHRDTRTSFCGASLINNRYALTAAHCFDAVLFPNAQLLFRSHKMNPEVANETLEHWKNASRELDLDNKENSFRVNIANVLIHPAYHPFRLDYDIAIIELEKTINLTTDNILPICLPEVEDVFQDFANKTLTLAGWGLTNFDIKTGASVLQTLDVEVSECKLGTNTKRHFCAGTLGGGKGACNGDSGGPLIAPMDGDVKNQYLLAGIASAADSNNCTTAGIPAVFTNVQELVEWVYQHTNDGRFCKKDPHKKQTYGHKYELLSKNRPDKGRRRHHNGKKVSNKARGRNLNPGDEPSGEDFQRQPLPPGNLSFNQGVDEIDCNGNYSITEKGFLRFNLDSPDEPCQLGFVGSVIDHCRVALKCKGKVSDSAISSTCRNDADYFKVYDNTSGEQHICGSTAFEPIPKVARNNGTNLFVIYKASSASALCTVFCVEDVTGNNFNIEKLLPLPQIMMD